ncbi:MAG: lycopene cyclase domain-containing protein [Bacteroidota bacterium]
MSLFAWILLLSLIGPLIISFNRKISFYKNWERLFAGIIINATLFILLGGWFARKGIWGFNPDYVWDIRLNNLPLEEWCFFIIIPYSSILIYTFLKAYLTTEPFAKHKHHITLFFLIATFFFALFNSTQAYTFYVCLIASVLLFIHYLFLKKQWMGYFWLAYFVFLVPFLIIDGALTGMFTDKPIVWYNNHENIGIRFFTISIEDAVYALTCMLLPFTIMEMLSDKLKRKRFVRGKHK